MKTKKKKFNCIACRDLREEQRKEWQGLWRESGLSHIYNSPDFFESCLEAFHIQRYVVIFCYRKGKIRGVLPLVEDRVFGIRTLSGPGRKGNRIDKSVLLMENYDKEVFDAVMKKALELGNLYLAEADEKIKPLIDFRIFPHVAEWASRSLKVHLSPESDTLKFMPSGQRRNLLRRIRRRKDDLEFKFFETNLEEALQKVIGVEKGSYKPHRHMALFSKAESEIFFRSLIRRNPESVRIGILYYRREPAATILGFVYGGTFAGYHTAFLKEYWHWGAGKAVIYFLLEHLKKQGFSKLDLMRGDSDSKRQFAEDAYDHYNIYFSKNRAILLWWKLCVPVKSALKKAKASAEAAPAAFISAFKLFSHALSGKLRAYFGFLANFLPRRRTPLGKDPTKKRPPEKKVIIFSTYDGRGNPYYGGGGAIAIHEVAKRLTRQFKVRVLTGKYPGSLKRESLDNVYYERIGSALLGPKLGHIIFHCALPFYAARNNFDLWVESFTPPFSTSFIPIFTKKPVIGLAHMLSAQNMRRKYKIPFHWIEDLGLKRYRHIIATSAYFRDYIAERNPKAKIAEIANGVSLDEFRATNGHARKYISFLGRIEMDQKGIDLLLDAYRRIAGCINMPLAIAGAGLSGEEERLKRTIREAGLEGRVILKGRISDKERIVFLRQSYLNVIPSRFETFSLVALETLAAGALLVSFNIEGLRWIPEGCLIRAAAFNPESLTRAILKGVMDQELRNRVIAGGNAFVENFSWDEVAEQYGKLIHNILNDHGKERH